MKHLLLKAAAIATVLVGVGACDKQKNVDPPMELVKFQPSLAVDKVWSVSTRKGDEALRLGLAPAVAGDRAYLAGHGGDVHAVDAATGRGHWRVDTSARLSAGPAVGGDLVVVATVGGELIALDRATGAQRWRVPMGGEVLAAPAVAGDVVVVRTVNGNVFGLAAADGRETWNFEQPVPRLSLRGTAPPTVVGDTVLASFDNGRVAALTLAGGDLLWTATVSPATGRSEIERLRDIDSGPQVRDRDVYVASYQGRVAMLALESGQIWWARELSSHQGLAIDEERLYVTAADSGVVALRRRDGTELWRQEQFLRRGLSAPAVTGGGIVVGDFEGYLHWLDPATGAVHGRAKTSSRIRQRPVVFGELLLVQSEAGEVSAFRARPLR